MNGARTRFLVLWTATLLAKFLLAASLPLFGDEAFYAWEGRRLAPAYADLPGLTAWMTALGALLPLEPALAWRLPFVLLGGWLPFGVVMLARRLDADDESAWNAGSLALLVPLGLALGPLALPDVALAAATLLCLIGLAGLLHRDRGAVLLALGLVLGGLAHYRFALLLPFGLLGLLATREGRALPGRPKLWLALAAGAAAWLPVLAFNLQHQGAGLAFQFVDRHPFGFEAMGLTQALQQALLLGPTLWLALLAAAWFGWRRRDRPGSVLVAVAAGGLVLALALAAPFVDRDRVSFHWPVPAWLALCALLPGLLARVSRTLAALVLAPSVLVALAMLAAMALTTSEPGRERLARLGYYPDNFGGWPTAVAEVRAALARLPDTRVVVADNFMLAAQLRAALPAQFIVHSLDHPLNHKHGRALQLAIWRRDADALARLKPGTPMLLVFEPGASKPSAQLALYQSACAAVGEIGPLQGVLADGGAKRFLLAPARRAADAPCVTPALGWIDRPAERALLDGATPIEGWAFKDGAGVGQVWLTLDGRPLQRLDYGLPAPRVAPYWGSSRDPAHPEVGFAGHFDPSGYPPGRYRLGLLVYGRDGSREPLPGPWVELDQGN